MPKKTSRNITPNKLFLIEKCHEFLTRELRRSSVKRRLIELSFLFIGINEIMNKFRGYFVIINEEMMITSYSFNGDIVEVIETFLPFLDSLVKCKRIFCIPCNTFNFNSLFYETFKASFLPCCESVPFSFNIGVSRRSKSASPR